MLIHRLVQIDDWCVEVTQLRARKTSEYGAPYSAVATITIVDGKAHIEGFLSQQAPTKQDFKTLQKLLDSCSATKHYQRFKQVKHGNKHHSPKN